MKLKEISYSKIASNSGNYFDVVFSLVAVDEYGRYRHKSYKLYGEHLGLLEPISNEQLNSLLTKVKMELLALAQDDLKLIDKLWAEFINDFNHATLVCRKVSDRGT